MFRKLLAIFVVGMLAVSGMANTYYLDGNQQMDGTDPINITVTNAVGDSFDITRTGDGSSGDPWTFDFSSLTTPTNISFGTNMMFSTASSSRSQIVLDFSDANTSGTGEVAVITRSANNISAHHVTITNVGTVNMGGVDTRTIRTSGAPHAYAGHVKLYSDGDVRTDYILTGAENTLNYGGPGDVTVVAGGNVFIESSDGSVLGLIDASTFTRAPGTIYVKHVGHFRSAGIRNYTANHWAGASIPLSDITMDGTDASGDFVTGDIDSDYKPLVYGAGAARKTITIRNYHHVSTAGISSRHSGTTGYANNVNISENITGNITISGGVDLYHRTLASRGSLTLASTGTVTLAELDLSKMLYATLAGSTNTITGVITGTDGAILSGSGGVLNNGANLRTPAGTKTYYNVYANPELGGDTYALADEDGIAGSGGTLETNPVVYTVYTSTKTGNWNDPMVWDLGAVPTNTTDVAIILTNHVVTITNSIATIAGIDVKSGAEFVFQQNTAIDTTQHITMRENAKLSSTIISTAAIDHILRGLLTVEGNFILSPGLAGMHVYSTISGTGDISITGGLSASSNQRGAALYGNNTFIGDIIYTKQSTYLGVGHVNALGRKTNMVVHVESFGAAQPSDANQLQVVNGAVFPTNVVEVILDGGTYPSQFFHGRDSVVNTLITMDGGTYRLTPGGGTGVRYNTGEIALASGTTNSFIRAGSPGSTAIYFDGLISGTGSLYVWGGDGNSPAWHFRSTTNTYSGGTRIDCTSFGQDNKTVGYDGSPFGTGPIWLHTVNRTIPLLLGENATWTNNIRGQGRINTSTHTLTVVGSLSPFDTGFGETPETVVGPQTTQPFLIDNLQFGTATDSATYYWDYNETANDVVDAVNLSFGTATQNIVVNWVPNGIVKEGTFVIFTWTGATNPTLPEFNVTGLPSGYRALITGNTSTKEILMSISSEVSGGGESKLISNDLLVPNSLLVR